MTGFAEKRRRIDWEEDLLRGAIVCRTHPGSKSILAFLPPLSGFGATSRNLLQGSGCSRHVGIAQPKQNMSLGPEFKGLVITGSLGA